MNMEAIKHQLKKGWTENPDHPIETWKMEVMNDHTRMSYQEWCDLRTILLEDGPF